MPLEDLVLKNRKTADSIRQLLGFDKQLEDEYNAENAQLAAYTNTPKDILESQRESDPEVFHQQMAQYPSVAPEMHDSDIKAQQEQLVQDQMPQGDPYQYQDTISELSPEQAYQDQMVAQEGSISELTPRQDFEDRSQLTPEMKQMAIDAAMNVPGMGLVDDSKKGMNVLDKMVEAKAIENTIKKLEEALARKGKLVKPEFGKGPKEFTNLMEDVAKEEGANVVEAGKKFKQSREGSIGELATEITKTESWNLPKSSEVEQFFDYWFKQGNGKNIPEEIQNVIDKYPSFTNELGVPKKDKVKLLYKYLIGEE